MAQTFYLRSHKKISYTLLALLCFSVLGLFELSWNERSRPHGFVKVAALRARAVIRPLIFSISHDESIDAVRMQTALDRMGYSLDAVAHGYMSVPLMLTSKLPYDLEKLDAQEGRKLLFLRLILPVVLYVNSEIATEREHLLDIQKQINMGSALSARDVQWVTILADKYEQPGASVDALLQKVDLVPPAIALAQAIEESGWGTSKIARKNNALFGQFGQSGGGDWNYRVFPTITETVAAYMHNLNTHAAYKEFRQLRAKMENTGGEVNSLALAMTLHRYSERGDQYVQDIVTIITNNNLTNFDSSRLNHHHITAFVASNETQDSSFSIN